MSDFVAGGLKWNPDARNHLRETSWEGWRLNCGAAEDAPEFLPEIVVNRQKVDHDCQGRMNACTGFGGSSAVEVAYRQEYGKDVKLSPMYAYISAQFECGIGGDNGATIDALRRVLTGQCTRTQNAGVCREESFRFTGKYYIPSPEQWPSLNKESREFIVPTTSQIRSYEDALNFVRAFGPVVIGSTFLRFMAQSNVRVFGDRQVWDASSVGMHCYLICGWSARKDPKGRRYLYVANSWPDWGDNGIAEFSPTLIDNLYRDKYTDSFGVTYRGPTNPAPVGMLSYRRSRKAVDVA